ncbi:hypothetical protein PGUG_03995 [Meyerozyma guilliermondii ATCC 6260]|uniref:NADH dehydrogenase [ubiquinone] 1 alpha subcomplex assembly factor 3 n=1 Tax=Meyerozyma guilliermondii (strain ATCC 6260 / CBS 566 / DSM 6381 / JCM 1539 / NBRC 10279 / NRRL Y-324) TaxID=294746 RepID=A5DL44_PICGU|nr:uncharacterized protein PGUG_03995 [Meyerozyma guilliermondii ATCC 6260]EDK39897.1 hypothetical protein PGUG_03995 [Meyerozyma guilliermondii ATCC 6260]
MIRRFTTISRQSNLFGGRVIGQKLQAPSGKSQTTANPVDMIKKNDILMFSQKPMNYVESVKKNGFHLANNLLITSPNSKGDIVGTLLLETESFEVNLSNAYKIINGFIVEFDEEILQIFTKVHPKPELLVVGLGHKSRILSEANRKYLSFLGMQLEVSDSNIAAQNYDLLATERPNVIAALLLPPNV